MHILFASPHRDLNACYQVLLSEDGDTIDTAFDGTQVLTLLKTDTFDLLILDQNIPRVDSSEILKTSQQAGLPSILLMDTPTCDTSLVTGTIAYPFLPQELSTLIREVTDHE